MRMILIIFQKKFCLGQIDYFGPIGHILNNSGSAVRIFLIFEQ